MAEYLHIHLPEINVIDFFQNGYIPEAMVNFIALLGWSPGDNREIMNIEELIEAFDLNRLIKANSLFDRQKLISLNMEHLRMVEPENLLEHFKNYLKVSGSALTVPLATKEIDDDILAGMLKVSEGARTLAQVEEKCSPLFLYPKIPPDQRFYSPPAQKVLQKQGVADLLIQTRDTLALLETWTEETLHQALVTLCEKNGVGMGKVAQPLRVAITGTTISPGISESLNILEKTIGKEKTLLLIDDTLEYMKSL